MKNVLNFIGKALSFDFVETYAVKKGLAVATAAITGLLLGPAVAGHLPAAIPGGPAEWQNFVMATLSALYAAGVNAAKHYGAEK